MQNNLTRLAKNALSAAADEARSLGTSYIGTEHLLLGLLIEEDSVASSILHMHDITYQSTRRLAEEMTGAFRKSAAEMTPGLRRIIENAANEAACRGSMQVGTEDLLLAMISERECVAVKLMLSQNASISEIKGDITSFFGDISDKRDERAKSGEMQSAILTQYGKNMTSLAMAGLLDPLVGREREVERMIAVLSRRQKNNPCLIGEPGVGKTAVVEGLCERIAAENVPKTLIGKSVISLDLGAMIAGAKYRGEFEERLKRVMDEVIKNSDIILFIDEIHTIVGAGAAEGAVDAANILKPYMARGEIQVIGATTTGEYRRHIEKEPALERRFQPIMLNEPSEDEAVEMIRGIKEKYERHHNVIIGDEAISSAVRLSKRYIFDRFLPDKAIDLIDEAAAMKRIEAYTIPDDISDEERRSAALSALKENAIRMQNFEEAARLRDEAQMAERRAEEMRAKWRDSIGEAELTINEDDIARVITLWTDVPVGKIDGGEGRELIMLEENISKHLIGQKAAIHACAAAIRRGRAGFSGKDRPICSLLFVGGSGVGKTELSRLIALELFGSRDDVIRIDMSEYMERHSVSRLIGSPPGYVGFGEGGELTESVRRRPYSVVLFDEVEKAHFDVLGILLQILDDGVLTDSEGRKVDFKSTVIIMTSNVGFGTGLKRSGFVVNNAERERSMVAVRETFRPELLNRIDEVIFFDRLSDAELLQIAELRLRELTARSADVGITLELCENAAAEIIKRCDISLGARQIRRIIGGLFEDELSNLLIKGEISRGDTVYCDIDDGGVKITKK